MAELSASIQALADAIVSQNPVHAEFLTNSLAGLSDETLASLQEYVEYCTSRGKNIAYLADCYNTIVNDTRDEQFFFMKNARYRYSRYADVADKVYFDPEYMNKYMYGLALTAFLWPNHAQMFRFFVEAFPKGRRGAYLEVGPGHGYYLMKAAELGNFDELIGIDISPTSVAMTRDILHYLKGAGSERIDIVEGDFLALAGASRTFDCVVMGEVLEHVERPELFLRAIADLSDRDTHVFITTCVNAPAIDHIFLFRSPKEIEDLIERCGFDIAGKCYVPYFGKTLEECERSNLAVNTAYVLRKR